MYYIHSVLMSTCTAACISGVADVPYILLVLDTPAIANPVHNYYPFQNRRRVIASWITREREQLWRSGFHHNVAKTGARNDMWKLKISSRSVGGFKGGGIEKLPCRKGKVRWIFVFKACIRCRKSFSTILYNSQACPTLHSNARGAHRNAWKAGF